MVKSTMDMVGKILAEDDKTAAAQRKRADKGDGYYGGPVSVGDYRERIEFKKADAGGMIACWYGPNGSRDIVVKDADEAADVLKKFFSGESDDDSED